MKTIQKRLRPALAVLGLTACAAAAQSAGDNAWVSVSAALVLLMTGPGLALFYGGLVRKKNVLSTMLQSFILMGAVTVLWALYGYSLAFAEGTPFVGGAHGAGVKTFALKQKRPA